MKKKKNTEKKKRRGTRERRTYRAGRLEEVYASTGVLGSEPQQHMSQCLVNNIGNRMKSR